MTQTRKTSLVEVCTGTFAGFIVSLCLTFFVLPVWGFKPSPLAAMEITVVYTIASILRGYVVRRVFNKQI